MIFVCPKPHPWGDIYIALKEEWERQGKPGSPPPKALILNGWAYTNDYFKAERWQETIHWAAQQGIPMPHLGEEDRYCVDELSRFDGDDCFETECDEESTNP